MIGASRARVLYNAGYRTPEAIVNLPARKLATLLESRRGARGGEMRAAKAILRGAKVLCEEQRRAAREESEAKLRQLKKLAPIDEDDREDEKPKASILSRLSGAPAPFVEPKETDREQDDDDDDDDEKGEEKEETPAVAAPVFSGFAGFSAPPPPVAPAATATATASRTALAVELDL